MSPASSTDKNRGVYVQKPKSDIYTVLLIISAVAVLVGILFLYLEISSYSSMSPPQLGMASPPQLGMASPPQRGMVSPPQLGIASVIGVGPAVRRSSNDCLDADVFSQGMDVRMNG